MRPITRPMAKRNRLARLRIKVDHQNVFALLDVGIGEIDRGGGFADPAFLIGYDNYAPVHIGVLYNTQHLIKCTNVFVGA